MSAAASTRPFAAFEWLIAMRYLRARRQEGFISVIAGFSFIGIMLGVATLIIVMAVMNGFRNQLYDKILEELFNAKFSEALKTVGKRLEFEQLYTQRGRRRVVVRCI